jgi:ferrous iron transport protein B
MTVATQSPTPTVALIGNPNTGKSTLFAALSGVHQRIANYPGVTVEKKVGQMTAGGRKWTLVDLPGTYSLAPRSLDEMVAVDVLLGRRDDTPAPDAVLCIVDATNLERNLYLVSQALELGRPTVVALTMTDIAEARGLLIDLPKLRKQLGVPVVAVQGHKRRGLDELKQALSEAVERPWRAPESPFPALFREEVARLESVLEDARVQVAGESSTAAATIPRYLVERLLLDTGGYLEGHVQLKDSRGLTGPLAEGRARLQAAGFPVPAVEAIARYGWVGRVLEGVVNRPDSPKATASDRVDRVLTHRLIGTVVFIGLMAIMFQAVFTWAGPLMDLIDRGVGWLQEQVNAGLSEGPLQSLIADGLIAGVGGVVIFLPQIAILFLFIAILEDCGYLARAAYLMDRLMTRVGLSGKSFIPLLSSFACAIPGVMAARVIEDRRDRLTTILVAPLMSCSARLPVYVLLVAAFVPKRLLGGVLNLQALVMLGMYAIGVVTAAGVALVLKRTIFRGPAPPFVMELPSYKWPSWRVVLERVLERCWSFIYRAGTIIVAVSILLWALLYYPRLSPEAEARYEAQRIEIASQGGTPDATEARRAEIDLRAQGQQQRESYLGRAGRMIEPIVRPLGWDWRIGAAAIASFPAREVVLATLGVIFDVGGEVDDEEGQTRLGQALKSATNERTGRPLFNLPVALSITVFFALCAQCVSTLAVIRRETNSWGWAFFNFAYMTILAYVGAFLTYQVGMLLLS